MKIALCFIIHYEHILEKEEIWRKWIEPNKDIINIYFHYSDRNKINSPWILDHSLPEKNVYKTSYMNVIPAYLALINYAIQADPFNQWFCFLTDSCCPIISPRRFRYLFFTYSDKTILSWRKSWWRTDIHKRANLALLPSELHLANDPWFILSKIDAQYCLLFIQKQDRIVKTIVSGGLANESLFAIILYCKNRLSLVISAVTHITDWTRMTSATSPYVFYESSAENCKFIEDELKKNEYAIFIRKINKEFPDKTLEYYIYEYSTVSDNLLRWREPINRGKITLFILLICSLYFCYFCRVFIISGI
jgi:hypothetical protein